MNAKNRPQIGRIIRYGVTFDPKNWGGSPRNTDSLIQAVQDLFTILAERRIEYVLVGGVALLYYIEGRNTQDLDLLMAISSLEKLPELEITTQDQNFVRAALNVLQIDVLLTQNPLFKLVQQAYATKARFPDRDIPIATVEGLLLLKLYALPSLYHQGDFTRVGIYENDIATLIQTHNPDINDLLETLSEYMDEADLVEIQNILSDIQKRLDRFNQK